MDPSLRRRAALRAIARYTPLLALLMVFAACLAWTTHVAAQERSSLDRVAQGSERPERLALLGRLDRATQVGRWVFGGSTLLVLLAVARSCRRRPSRVATLGGLPYRSVQVRVDGPLAGPFGLRERRFAWAILVACAASSGFTWQQQRALDDQRLSFVPMAPGEDHGRGIPGGGLEAFVLDCTGWCGSGCAGGCCECE